MKGNRGNPLYRPYLPDYPSPVILDIHVHAVSILFLVNVITQLVLNIDVFVEDETTCKSTWYVHMSGISVTGSAISKTHLEFLKKGVIKYILKGINYLGNAQEYPSSSIGWISTH